VVFIRFVLPNPSISDNKYPYYWQSYAMIFA
jgi:hypothetical protein